MQISSKHKISNKENNVKKLWTLGSARTRRSTGEWKGEKQAQFFTSYLSSVSASQAHSL